MFDSIPISPIQCYFDFPDSIRDNVWKLHGLPKSIVLDKGPQFAAELTKELNRMLGIEIRLLTAFYPQIDSQTEQMNQRRKTNRDRRS